MAIDVLSTVVIKRTPDDVWRYLINYENDPNWIGGVQSSRLVSDPPLRHGSRVSRTASFLGKRFEYVTEIVALDPEKRVEMHADRPIEVVVTYEIESEGDGTRVSVRNQGNANGLYNLASPVLARAIRRNVDKDLERLKAILEREQVEEE